MRNTLYSETHTGAARHAFRPFSLLETTLIESEARDGKIQTERVLWTWKVHEVALHEASQREGMLIIGGNEPLLKKVSEEVTRKAQEKLRVARSHDKP